MQTLYFFSGFDVEKGFPSDIAESLCQHVTERKSIVLICTDPTDHEKVDMHKVGGLAWFENIGITFEDAHALDSRKTAEVCQELIKNASVLFLMGGSPHLQMQFIKAYGLLPVIRQFDGVIMGISAGAMSMAENTFYSADKNFNISHIHKGIGLADVSVAPHFFPDDEALFIDDILPFSYIIDIYAMCDDSAILFCDGKKTIFGEIYFVSKGSVIKM